MTNLEQVVEDCVAAPPEQDADAGEVHDDAEHGQHHDGVGAQRGRDGFTAHRLAWVGIHGCRNCIYDRKIYDSVVDLLMKLAQFWYFGHVSKSLVAKSTTAMNPNPGWKTSALIPHLMGFSC